MNAILPAYLVNLLTYFYLRTKNFKMARSMVKSRRFVVDQDHISQQVKPPEAQSNSGHAQNNASPAASVNKYVKKPVVMVNYKSLSKNFT